MSPVGEILVHILAMTFLATRQMHYVENPKHNQLIRTVLLFATKKAKQQRMDLNEKLAKLDLKQKAGQTGFKRKVEDHRGFK